MSPFKAKCLANSGWRHAQLIEHRINTTLFKGEGRQPCGHRYPKVNPIEVHVIVFHHYIHHTLLGCVSL